MAGPFFGGAFFGGGFFARLAGGVRRRWALKREGRYHYFENLQKLEAFRRAEDHLVIPRKTEAIAKSVGYPSIRLVADMEQLRQIERDINKALADDRDDEDFMQFLSVI